MREDGLSHCCCGGTVIFVKYFTFGGLTMDDAMSTHVVDCQQAFAAQGYLVLPSFLPPDLLTTLGKEVERWTDEGWRDRSIAHCLTGRCDLPALTELDLGEHGWLLSHPPLMAVLDALMGPGLAFHHLHSHRHDPGIEGKDWHHDYEQPPQRERTHLMVHVLHYLNGLDGTIGDLVLMPGSQHQVVRKDAWRHLGTRHLAGEVVIDRLPAGSTVIMHSAMFHARRARRGGHGRPRYFIDASYCQAGVRWPTVKPYWRALLTRARSLGLDRNRWPGLFDERHFLADPEPALLLQETVSEFRALT